MFFFFLDFTISSFLEWMENFRRSFFFFRENNSFINLSVILLRSDRKETSVFIFLSTISLRMLI